FTWGRWLVADPDAVARALRPDATSPTDAPTGVQAGIWDPTARSTTRAAELLAAADLPEDLRPLLERRAAQLLDYQGERRLRRWLTLVTAALAVDDPGRGHALTRAVAEGWFKLLTYKDEYEVARLHL